MQAILAAPPADTARDTTVVAFRPRSWVAPAPMALAASLLLAVGVGSFLAGRGAAPQAVASPGVAAAAALATLATGAETTLEGGATARVLGSYETDQGLCRLIDLAHPDSMAERAVVCRQGGADWAVIASVTAGQAEVYIPASDTAAALIDQVLDDLGAGPALSAMPKRPPLRRERPKVGVKSPAAGKNYSRNPLSTVDSPYHPASSRGWSGSSRSSPSRKSPAAFTQAARSSSGIALSIGRDGPSACCAPAGPHAGPGRPSTSR